MSSINTLNAYGHVLEAWLWTSLDSTHLSRRPRLSWFEAEKLQRRIWNYIDPPTEASSGQLALYSHYEDALLAMAGDAFSTATYRNYYTGFGSTHASTQEHVLQLNLSLSRTSLFDHEGRFRGDVTFLGADGRELDLAVAAVLADPYTFDNADRSTDGLVVLLPSALPDGTIIALDFDRDGSRDLTLGPLVYEPYPYAEPWKNDAFQLDLIRAGQRIAVPGMESTSEGWLDADQNRVVLLGNTISLQNGDLVQFGYDQALPDNLVSWQAYTVADLQNLETPQNGAAVSFQLLDTDNQEPVVFGSSEGTTDNLFPFGIRLAPAALEDRLVAADLYSANNQHIPLDPAVLADLRLQVRDTSSSSWLEVPLASASAAWSELRINIEPSEDLNTIPADWQVRLSYDDLLQESISPDDLNSGVYLQFDDALISQILAALDSGELEGATLTIGDTKSELFNFNLGDYSTSTALYAAIGSAPWVNDLVDQGLLRLSGSAAVTATPIPPASPGRSHQEFRNRGAFAALKDDGSVITWGSSSYGGNSSSVSNQLQAGVTQIFSTDSAFAALKDDGSVITWGSSSYGGDSNSVSNQLQSGVTQIFSTSSAFAALKDDGSVITWGSASNGGNSSSVSNQLQSGITQIFSNDGAFTALKDDDSVITWGSSSYGGNSSSVSNQLQSGVTQIFSTDSAFAALKDDGSVITWGSSSNGGNSSSVSNQLQAGVTQVFSNDGAFAALKDDGSVITWGSSSNGGNSSSVSNQLQSGVTQIFSTDSAFAALKDDGSVITWGSASYGGDSSSVSNQLQAGVTQVFSNDGAFAALKDNGSVVIWGSSLYGGYSSSNQLQSGVTQIFSTDSAFAALKDDGSVITWGSASSGGDSNSVSNQLQSGVTRIFSTSSAFAALKDNGSVITWGSSVNGGDSSSVATEIQSGVITFADPFNDDHRIKASPFKLQLGLVIETKRGPEPVYNAAQLVRADGDGWAALDPDGFSLWGESDGGLVAIDRYGDQLDRLGHQPAGSEPPFWSDYHPWASISGDLFQPWDKQRTSPKTIELEGNAFDGGDDLLVTFSLDLPDDPQTTEWEGDWRTYVLLFDLFASSDEQLSQDERNALFDQELYSDLDTLTYEPRFSVPVDITAINGGVSLSATELLKVFTQGLTDFLASAPADLSGFATPAFSLSSPTATNRNGRTVLEAVLDFPAPEQGALKPSVSLWSRVLDDPTNTQAYDAAWDLYQQYSSSNEQEWLNNYGSRAPQFHSAWIDPLSEAEDADRTITLDFSGLDPLANAYTQGDIHLRLNNKLVDPTLYSVENLWGYQLQITLNADSGLQLAADSELSVSLADGHSFTDTAGIPLAITKNLAVDNWAAWQSYGFNPDGQLLLDQANSYADDKTIRLSFLGSADLSLDSSKAAVPESGDFQFWAYNYNAGTTTALELASTNPLKVDGKALVFSLAHSLGSDVSVDVTYDATLDSTANSDPFTNTKGVAAQAFYWQPIENRSPDKQGPSINWSSVFGNRLTLGLTDPAGVWVGNQELSHSNLPAPADFLIKATDAANGTSRTLAGTSISLTPWGWNELELQLDANVEAGETLSLSYQGTSLQDGNGNLAELRQIAINNYTLAYDAGDASSWFQRNDLVKVVFDETSGEGGFFLMDNGSVSSTTDNFQIQDDYTFSLSELSTLTIDLTDKAGGRLDDAGDANLDFSLENLRTQSFIGGSWNSLDDSWLGSKASNDERDVKFVLPAGDYRLSVLHADLWQEAKQSYQLKMRHSPFSLPSTPLDTSEAELVDTANARLTDNLYLDVLDPGQLTATLPTSSNDAWLSLYDLNGQWISSSSGQSLSQYVLAGLYRLEVDSWLALPADSALSLKLDSSINLDVDTDSAQAPSGAISVNGLPIKGDLNPLDREDFWTLKLNGGQIYSLRASGFSDDVNLIVNDAEGYWVADSWNWGTYAEDGSFTPSDETVVLDLSDKAAGTYSYTAQVQTWGSTPTHYRLTAKSHPDRTKADEEAARGVVNYDSLFDDFFGDKSNLAGTIDFTKDDLEALSGLQSVSSDKLRELKASLEKQGFNPSGTVLAFQSTLTGSDPNPLLISKSTPQTLPQGLRETLAANEPGELSQQQSQLQFGPKQVAALVNDTKDEASDVEPVSKPVGVTVESRQRRLGGFLAQDPTFNQLTAGPGLAPELEGYDLGLQRIAIPLDDNTRAALNDPTNAAKTLVWYKTPASGQSWLFSYDTTTNTGSRLEDTDAQPDGRPDVLALYIQDGGRGDDDGEVNGVIATPGGLALAQLQIQDPLTTWNGDIDGDGLFSPLNDGLAIIRRFSQPELSDDPLIGSYAVSGSPRTTAEMLARIDEGFDNGHLDLDRNSNIDNVDLALAQRHGFGTFPGQALMAGLNLPESLTLEQLNKELLLLVPPAGL